MGFQNPRCVNGTCQDTTCGAIGENFCQDGVCRTDAELANDPAHCGANCIPCNGTSVCAAGQCRFYFPPPGCNACPCPACGAGTTCCPYPGANEVICVQGNVCPQ